MHAWLIAVAVLSASPQSPPCPGDTQPPVTVQPGLVVCATGVPLPLDAEGETGVRIGVLDASHPLARKGMRTGDVLFRIDGQRVSTGAEAAQRLQAALKARDALINYRREGLPLLLRTGRTPD